MYTKYWLKSLKECTFGRPRHRLKNLINLMEITSEDVDWTHLAQDSDWWLL
jgi:hypothetical protein